MIPRTISRRSLVATAIGGTVAWLGEYLSLLTTGAGCAYHSELIALCSDLRCPETVGKACLLALPASESTRSSLARTILADVDLARRNRSASAVLAQAISERSRTDFRDGRVVTVDGWVLSLTETRRLRACRIAFRGPYARRVIRTFRSDAESLSPAVRPLMHADCSEAWDSQ